MTSMSNCTFDADHGFGPVVQLGCRGGFDFTLPFERSILTLLPAAVFLLGFLARFAQLARAEAKTVDNPLRKIKTAAALLFVGVQAALIVLYSRDASSKTSVSIAAGAFNLVISLQFVALSWIEDARSVRPSTPLLLYLVLTTSLDLAQARSLWLLGTNNTLAGLFSASLATKVALLALEAQHKRRYLKEEHRSLPPESTSGIINRSFLWWITHLIRQGFRSLIEVNDLFELDDELRSAHLKAKLQQEWEGRQKPERRFELVWALCRALWWPLFQAVIPKLGSIALTLTQPFLISAILELVAGPVDEISTNKGYGLIAATGLIYFGITILDLHYNQVMSRCLTMSRGALVALIYDRALLIPDSLYDEATAVTLMSSDTAMISTSMENVHAIWASIVQVGVGLFLLARQMGWVCITPLIVISVMTYLTSKITFQVAGQQKAWVTAVQKRVAITSTFLSEMRSIKMMGLGRLVTKMLQALRVHETSVMARYRWNIVWKNVLSNLCYQIAPPVTFAVFGIQAAVRGAGGIDTAQAFASLSIISLLTGPFAHLIQVVPSTAAGLGSFDRVQKFLMANARVDSRKALASPAAARDEKNSNASNTDTNSEESTATAHRKEERSGSPVAVSFDDVDLRPAPAADVVVRGANFSILQGAITMIIGPVASGKSTLLKAILGETTYEKGTISVADRRIAYCGQTPWLPNSTIRKAICGHVNSGNVDETWYRTCIQACDLEQDLDNLPNGDQTSIGSGATALSGGQRHRVALARALYTRAKIVVLDSVLGALDNHTKKSIVESLFGKSGLFRQIRSTVVLVTHEIEYLRHADQILILANGTLEYNGSYSDAVQSGLIEKTVLNEPEGSGQYIEEKSAEKAKKLPFQTPKETDRQDLARKTGDFSLYSYYFRSIGWPKTLIYLSFVLLEVFGNTFSPLWLKMWSESNGDRVGLYAPIYVLMPFIQVAGLGGFIWCFMILIAPSSSNKLHQILLDVVMRAPQSFFSVTDTGSILNRFSQDMTLIESVLPSGAGIFVANTLEALGMIGLIATGSVYMTATIPVVFLGVYLLQHIYLRTSRQLRLLDLESKSPLYSHFLETLGGLATIRAFDWQRDNVAENMRLLDLSQRPHYLLQSCQKWLTLVLGLIVAGEAMLIVGLAVGLRSLTSPGLLGVSLVQILGFEGTLGGLVDGWTGLETSLGAISRIRAFEKEVKPEEKEGENIEPPQSWPERGDIEFRSVTASHNPSAVALHDVSITIKSGQKVGICGRTGSGKSSFVATVLRLLEINDGSIMIDGLDLATIPRDIIRERLVTLPQDPLILVGTVRFNADPHGRATDLAIIEALSDVGLWASFQDFGGLDAEMTASSLSKGQQQLFALARAFLQKGKIMLLDEPTSNIDPETDAIIQRLLKENFTDCTVLTVAHRMETILGSDVVAVLEDGRVVEFGAPAELLQTEGRFTKLVRG